MCDQAGLDSGGPVIHLVVSLVAGCGLGVKIRYVPGVFGIQRDGDTKQVLAQRRERLVQGESVPASWGTGRGVTSGQSSCFREVARARTGAMLGAVASRAVSGGPRSQRCDMRR